MDFVKDFKDFEKLLRLCRKNGVTEIKLGAVEMKLGVSADPDAKDITAEPKNGLEGFPTDRMLSPEELMYYSSGGPANPNLEPPEGQGDT